MGVRLEGVGGVFDCSTWGRKRVSVWRGVCVRPLEVPVRGWRWRRRHCVPGKEVL